MTTSLSCLAVRNAVEGMQPLTAVLQSHADSCPTCQALLASELQMRTWVQTVPQQPVPASFSQRVMEQVASLPKPATPFIKKVKTPITTWVIPALVAAAFVVLWVSSPMFKDNPISNRLVRLSSPADDWVMAHLGPTDHDLLDHDPTDILQDTVEF
jgi:hypothetical protein